MSLRRLLLVAVALVVALAACTGSPSPTTTAPPPQTTTTSTTTTLPPAEIPGEASPSLDPATVELTRRQVAGLLAVTEEVRGLPFLEVPTVTILDGPDFSARVAEMVAEELDADELVRDARFFVMMGMLDADVDLRTFLVDLYTEQVAGFYDGDTKELVVPASPDGFSALQKVTVVHELIHGLTDQHFEFNDEFERRLDEGNGDDAAALQALIEGDATYFQVVYMESLPPLEALDAAREALSYDTSLLDAAPAWLRDDLVFPYDQGLTFVTDLVSGGGIAAVDDAYQEPPITTEQVLDPTRYRRREGPRDLPPLVVELPGWDLHDEGTLGEWGLRLILTGTLPPGMVTQTAAGWGNDRYLILTRDEDTAFVLRYRGDAEQDAEDVADGLVAHARERMGAGAPREAGGGLLFDRGETWVFIDRVGEEVWFVASTDPAAGAELRSRLGL